jgi:hypothetical protein
MKKKILSALLASFLLAPITLAQEKEKLRLVIPDATWEPIYFAHINEGAKAAKLPKLRAAVLPEGEMEIRIWRGFGLGELEGFIFRRSKEWSAFYLRGVDPRMSRMKPQRVSLIPKSGWDIFWGRLTAEGVLSLPDASELRDYKHGIKDGVSYAVEINMNRRYRTYHYSNPEDQEHGEAKHMVRINDILAEEFNLSNRVLETRGWRGIVPLHSTRADVEKRLGPPPEPGNLLVVYDYGDHAVSVEYSSGPCWKEVKGGWDVPPGTVISILIGFKERSTQFPPSRIDKRKFKRAQDGHLPSVHYFVNKGDGITYEVQEGMVQSVEYYAAAKDLRLRCPSQP